MPIESLPESTTRAIGSVLVLTDSCSVVKELVDNALDANATIVTAELSSNALDVIQVKDNGIGIAPVDRKLVCRRHCTSKIKTIEELSRLGGTSLGFRGEALSSIAALSSGLKVTTKIDGEVVAETLSFTRAGELSSSSRASHPTGTTVRVHDFLSHVPVRHETALKTSSKTIDHVKKLLQNYAFARPAVRFSVKILKGKDSKGDWNYIPGKEASLLDVATQVVGRDVSAQCFLVHPEPRVPNKQASHSTNNSHHEGNRPPDLTQIQVTALLPKADAGLSKITNSMQYLSVDGRPMSIGRGTPKEVVKLFKIYVQSAISRTGDTAVLSNPFLCLQIKCPLGSYDVNIEPAKNDVLFADPQPVVAEVQKVFESVYGNLEQASGATAVSKGPKTSDRLVEDAFDILLAPKRRSPGSYSNDLSAITDSTQPHALARGQNPGPPKRPWKGYRQEQRQIAPVEDFDLDDAEKSTQRPPAHTANLDDWVQSDNQFTSPASSVQRSHNTYEMNSKSRGAQPTEGNRQSPSRLPTPSMFDDAETVFGSSPLGRLPPATRSPLNKAFSSPLKSAISPSPANRMDNARTQGTIGGEDFCLEESQRTALPDQAPDMNFASAIQLPQTSQPTLSSMMDYEHRKKALLAAQRLGTKSSSPPKVNMRDNDTSQTSETINRNSPHRNRFRAAVAALNGSSNLHRLNAKALDCSIDLIKSLAQSLIQEDGYVGTGMNNYISNEEAGIRTNVWEGSVQELLHGANRSPGRSISGET